MTARKKRLNLFINSISRIQTKLKRNTNIYSHAFDGIIWNIEFDGASKTLLLEIRSNAEQSFELFLVSLESMESKKVKHKELEWFHKPVFYLNGLIGVSKFTSETTPELSGILVLNDKGEQLWVNDALTWDQNTFTINDTEGHPYDLRSGIKSQSLPKQSNQELVQVPIGYDPDSEHYASIVEFIGQDNLIGNIEYLEIDENNFVVSYNSQQGTGSICKLDIWNDGDGLVQSKKISSNENGIAFETFFLIDNFWVYTIEKSTLEILKL